MDSAFEIYFRGFPETFEFFEVILFIIANY